MGKLKTIILATENQGKLKELKQILSQFNMQILTLEDFPDYVTPEETGVTYEENAHLKSEAASNQLGRPVLTAALADDSGLSVEALNGDPGVYSARWAEAPDGARDFTYAMQKLLDALDGKENRNAAFHTVLAFSIPGEETKIFDGKVSGSIEYEPQGEGSFGYDPIFKPDGYAQTFGQMSFEEKLKISHRTNALEKFKQWIEGQYAK